MRKLRNVLITVAAIVTIAAISVWIYASVQHYDYLAACRHLLDTFIDTEDLFPDGEETASDGSRTDRSFSLSDVPEWDGYTAYVYVNGNVPYFTDSEKSQTGLTIRYSGTDILGRCGSAWATMSLSVFPTGERDDEEERMSVTPSGWIQASYPGLVDQDYLYNRCHLIAWRFGGEAVKKNLVTGTRYMNTEGMGFWEEAAADYAYSHGDSIIQYRVTPVFSGLELTCRGVLIEGYADGGSFEFCVFCYNEQPGITINHLDGSSRSDQAALTGAFIMPAADDA